MSISKACNTVMFKTDKHSQKQKFVQKESASPMKSASYLDDSCAGQVLFAGAGMKWYMWPRGPDLFQPCPGKKMFSPVGLDSLDIHRGAVENWVAAVGVGGAMRRVWRVMRQERGTDMAYYFGKASTWHLLCLMSKIKPGTSMRALCVCWPVVISFILWQLYLVEETSRMANHFSLLKYASSYWHILWTFYIHHRKRKSIEINPKGP